MFHVKAHIDGEDKTVNEHQQEGIQKGPDETEQRTAIARPELPGDERMNQHPVSVTVFDRPYHPAGPVVMSY